MEFVFELILELILEGSLSVSSNKKISKFIRYPIIFLLILFFGGITFGLIFIGFKFINENLVASLIFIIVGLFLLIGSIYKFKKVYIERK